LLIFSWHHSTWFATASTLDSLSTFLFFAILSKALFDWTILFISQILFVLRFSTVSAFPGLSQRESQLTKLLLFLSNLFQAANMWLYFAYLRQNLLSNLWIFLKYCEINLNSQLDFILYLQFYHYRIYSSNFFSYSNCMGSRQGFIYVFLQTLGFLGSIVPTSMQEVFLLSLFT